MIRESTGGYVDNRGIPGSRDIGVQGDTWKYSWIHGSTGGYIGEQGGLLEYRKIYRSTGGIYVSRGGFMEVDGDT